MAGDRRQVGWRQKVVRQLFGPLRAVLLSGGIRVQPGSAARRLRAQGADQGGVDDSVEGAGLKDEKRYGRELTIGDRFFFAGPASDNIMMRSKRHEPPTVIAGEQKILDFLETGISRWEEMQRATNLSDNGLGLVLGELLTKRLIWTEGRGGVRVYGLVLRRVAGR